MVERDEKGRVKPGQKLALGNKGGGAAGRVPTPDWFITGYTEKAYRCLADIIDGKTDADINLKQKTALEIINRNCGKVDANINVDASTTSPVLDALLALSKPKKQEPIS